MLFLSHCQQNILLAIIATAIRSASAGCHAPDGTMSPLDQPCYQSASDSFCCPPSSICSSNKVCILPDGQAQRGSCTDPSFSSAACPNFCLHRASGLRHSAGLNLTLCETDPDSTVYCCNEENGEACDCSAMNSRKVRLSLFNPVTTIIPANSVPSASLIRVKLSSGAAPTSTSSRFLQRPVHQVQRLFIPWKTLGPILLAVLVILFLASVVFFVRRTCLARRRQDARQASAVAEMERGRKYSDWAVYWDDKGSKSKSKFSIGSSDSEVSPSDIGKIVRASEDIGDAPKVSTLLSPKDDGLRRRKSDEHKKTSLDSRLEKAVQDAYLAHQNGKSSLSETARKMDNTGEGLKTSRIEEEQKRATNPTTTPTLHNLLNSPFVGRRGIGALMLNHRGGTE